MVCGTIHKWVLLKSLKQLSTAILIILPPVDSGIPYYIPHPAAHIIHYATTPFQAMKCPPVPEKSAQEPPPPPPPPLLPPLLKLVSRLNLPMHSRAAHLLSNTWWLMLVRWSYPSLNPTRNWVRRLSANLPPCRSLTSVE